VGTVKDTGPFGVKMGLPIPIGMPTIGGTMATQGGLVFIARAHDYSRRGNCLLTMQCFEWRFDDAWILGLGRHYLG
jgi:hypothetical protein